MALCGLPRDVLHYLLGFVDDPKTMAFLARTCKKLHEAAMRDAVWETFCRREGVNFCRQNSWRHTFLEQVAFWRKKESFASMLWMRLTKGRNTKQTVALLSGLFFVGVSRLIYHLSKERGGVIMDEIRTIGCNVEIMDSKNLKVISWNEGGSDRIRRIYDYYYEQINGLIWMVDVTNNQGMEEAKKRAEEIDVDWKCHNLARSKRDMHRMLREIERPVPLLILANRKERAAALSPDEIALLFDLPEMTRPWRVDGYGDGICDLEKSLRWLDAFVL